MGVKDDLLNSLLEEVRVIKFLAERIPADGAEWRPTEGQRSTIELLRYLANAAYGPALFMESGSREHFAKLKEEVATMDVAGFAAAMDLQGTRLRDLLAPLTDEELVARKATLFWGAEVSLFRALMDTSLKFLAAYRMQLFLYLKQQGVDALATSHCWAGREPAAKA